MDFLLKFLKSTSKWSLKLLVLCLQISFALIKLAISLVVLIFSLGMLASRTSKY